MGKKQNESSIVEQFAEIADRPVVMVQPTQETILQVVKGSPKKMWTQKEIREELIAIGGVATSNPAINGALRKLAETEKIVREQQSKHVFYRHMSSKSKKEKPSE